MKKLLILFTIINLFLTSYFSPSVILVQAYEQGQGDVEINALVPIPEEEPEEEVVPGGGGIIHSELPPPEIYDIEVVDIRTNSVRINWKTNELSIPQINYGKILDYEKTYIGKSFSIVNSISLKNLLPKTIYHFEIIAIDRGGNRTSTDDRTFKTLTLSDITPPANVINFESKAEDSQITLTWQNSPDPDFKAVKIMRSTDFYPSNPESGTLIYDSDGIFFTNTNLTNGVRYYYTAFAYDKVGNYASGAIVSVVPFKVSPRSPEEIFIEKECIEAGYYWYDKACHLELEVIPPPPEIEELTLNDFDFIQEAKKLEITEEGLVEIQAEKPLTISIDYEKVPEVLKTIMVTLEKDEKSFSFLLRVNKEKTAYLATLVPPEETRIFPLTLTVLDYKNQIIKKILGSFDIKGAEILLSILWYKKYQPYIYIILGIIILAVICYLLYKKYKHQESNKKQTSNYE